MVDLNKDVKYIKGVGPNRVKLLNKLNINTLKDLITYYPRTYEDRSKPKNICECLDGEEVLIEGISATNLVSTRIRGKTMQRLTIKDETGSCLITWFNQDYLKRNFHLGNKYSFFGKIHIKNGRYEMTSPVYDIEGKNNNTGKIIPIYPLTYSLSQNVIRKIIENGLAEVNDSLFETLPEYILKKYSLIEINKAIDYIHFPKDFLDFQNARNR